MHEIGHALGLAHISVLHDDPLCMAAILLDSTPGIDKSALPARFRSGSNSRSCYGPFAPPDRSDNVMGRGTQFAAVNAQPWRDRIAVHTMTNGDDWQVSVGKISRRKI